MCASGRTLIFVWFQSVLFVAFVLISVTLNRVKYLVWESFAFDGTKLERILKTKEKKLSTDGE